MPPKAKKKKEPKTVLPKPEPVFQEHEIKYVFTDKEKIEIMEKASAAHAEVQRLDAEAKASAQQWKLQIKSAKAKLDVLMENGRNGYAFQSHNCEVQFDWKAGKKTLLLNGEKVGVTDIVENDRILHLNLDTPKTVVADAFAKAEEELSSAL